jgi:hypothetical protein
LSAVAYVIVGKVAPGVVAQTMPLFVLIVLPFFAIMLPDIMTLWLEPDWLDENEETVTLVVR